MDYIKGSENTLRNYRRLQFSLETLERRRGRLIAQGGPSSKVTATLELTGVRGSGILSAEQLLTEIISITNAIKDTMEELKLVDDVLFTISEDQGCEWFGSLLKDWYIEKLPRRVIEKKYFTGERNVYNLRDKALKAFSIAWYGVSALKKGPN